MKRPASSTRSSPTTPAAPATPVLDVELVFALEDDPAVLDGVVAWLAGLLDEPTPGESR